jgi:hypothetical protein
MVYKRKKKIKSGLLLIIFLIWSGIWVEAEVVFAGIELKNNSTGSSEKDKNEILSLLGQRGENFQILDKAREKLNALNEEQLRLIASLSERITGNRSAGADMAYLLVTVLIILS